MADSASEVLDTFRRVADALGRRDWHGVAALCDPISLRGFHRQRAEQFAPRHVAMATLRRQSDGSWRPLAEFGFFQGMTFLGHAEIDVATENQPPPSGT